MATASVRLVRALRVTAERLRAGSKYEWGHFGACNCGHLARTLTGVSREDLQRFAARRGTDWRDVARRYCRASGYPIDDVVAQLVEAGLDVEDLARLEALDDAAVLHRLGVEYLPRNERAAAIAYLDAWAALLEQRLFERPSQEESAATPRRADASCAA